jgi:hypothetical protein
VNSERTKSKKARREKEEKEFLPRTTLTTQKKSEQ